MQLPRRPAAWLGLGLAALAHLGMLIGWRWPQPLAPYFFDATVLSGGRGLDFYSIYQAGHNARLGLDIYEGDPARVPIVVPYFTPYRYLPIDAYTVGAALSLLSPLSAYKLWVVVVELTLLGCAAATYWLARATPDRAAGLAAMWLAFTPYYLELFMGQFSLVQAALIFGVLAASAGLSVQAVTGQRGRVMDALWTASVLWKINTVVFGPAWLAARRYRALIVAGALVLATTLPYFAIFPTHFGDLIANNFGNRVTGEELGNLGFRQLAYSALAAAGAGPGAQAAAQAGVVALVGLAALGATVRGRKAPAEILLSLWLAAFFLASPQVWEHHYVMLLPAVVALQWRRPGRFVAVVWLLLALPTPFGFIGLQPVIASNHDLRAFALEPAWRPLLQHASKAAPTAALFGWCAWQAVRGGRAAAVASVKSVRMT